MDNIVRYLESLADAEIARHSRRFFKTGVGEYGEGDEFLGIRVPVLRRAVREYRNESLSTAEKLIASRYHEVRLFALLLMVDLYRRADGALREDIFRLYLAKTEFVNNWDLVDSSAHLIVGAHLADRDRRLLDDLAGSPQMWERRISIIATLHFIRGGEFEDTMRIAGKLLDDPHDLIHKAVGWMLREVGNRDRQVETEFLAGTYRRMPRTMLRYAIEKFDPAIRKMYLSGLY